jgi:hypothetical protein
VPLPHLLHSPKLPHRCCSASRINTPQTTAPGRSNLIATGYQPLPVCRLTQNWSLQKLWGLAVSSYTLLLHLPRSRVRGSLTHIFPTVGVTATPRTDRLELQPRRRRSFFYHDLRDRTVGSSPLVTSKRGGENCVPWADCSLLMPQSLGSSKMFHTCENGPPPLLQLRKC